VNSALPTVIVVAGIALAVYAGVLTVLNRRLGGGLLLALGVLEILLLVMVGWIVVLLVGGGHGHPPGMAMLIGYLIAMPLVPVAAAFWGAVERSRWGSAVAIVAGLACAVLMVRLHEIWSVIHV
jgi:hypothetical protein